MLHGNKVCNIDNMGWVLMFLCTMKKSSKMVNELTFKDVC